ncbi:hypothetical protein JCM21900_005986 [Sporobolomyces salmonicolor]
MNHNWAFEQLNQLTPSPGVSPTNGPSQDRNELTLSFPCDGSALQAQLEQWTNVAFDFDSPDYGQNAAFEEKPSSHVDDSKSLPRFSRGGESFFSAAHAPAGVRHPLQASELTSTVDLAALLGTSAPTASADSFGGSLVDPALSLPSFASAAPILPSFFASPSAIASPTALPALPPVTAPASASASTAAPSPASSSTTSTTKKAAAPKKKRASTAAAAAKALLLPEGIVTDGMTDEQLNQLAIEEDKRKRNTAASARFRVKKKQREAALEQSAKELRDRVAVLEKEVETLRTENGWLRGLIVDKTIDAGKDGADNTRKRQREDDEHEAFSSILV